MNPDLVETPDVPPSDTTRSDEPSGAGSAPSSSARPRLDLFLMALIAVGQGVLGRYLYLSSPLLTIDDEGYMTVMLREWARQGGLYDRVFSQYGPFHTLVFGGPVKLLGLDLSFTMGRSMTLAVHVGACLLFAVAVRSLTRSLWPAIGAQCGAFVLLSSLAVQSLHPGGLIMLVLAALVANVAVVRPRFPWWSDALTGGLAAALLLTKVNVGVMVVVALAYVAAVDLPVRRVRRWLLPLTEIAVLALGPALFVFFLPVVQRLPAPSGVLNQFNEPSTLLYWGLLYVCAAAVVLVASRYNPVGGGGGLGPAPMLAGFASAALVIAVAILATGTSPQALVEGVALRPSGQADVLSVLAQTTPWFIVWLPVTVLAVVLVGRLLRAEPTPPTLLASSMVRLVAAFCLVSAVPTLNQHLGLGVFRYPFVFLPLVALALVPTLSGGPPTALLARRVMVVLAVTHSLHAFPVAGAQLSWSQAIPVVIGFVVVADGVRELRPLAAAFEPVRRPLLQVAGKLGVVALAAVFLFQASSPWRQAYRLGEPVEATTMSSLRMPFLSAGDVTWLRSEGSDCDVLVSRPGMNWASEVLDLAPPTGFNTTLWGKLLTDDEQQAIVEQLESTDGTVCYLLNSKWLWVESTTSAVSASGPLLDYLKEPPWQPVSTRGGLRLMARPG